MQSREHSELALRLCAVLSILVLPSCASETLQPAPVLAPTASPITLDAASPIKYVPPPTFFGIRWGSLLSEAAAQRPGLELKFVGTPSWPGKARASIGCRRETAQGCVEPEFSQRVYGGGIEVMAEYTVPTLGYRLAEIDVLIYPVYYNFCAHPNGFGVPKTIRNELRLCGGREVFNDDPNETRESETAGKAPVYERVLSNLIAHFGYPDGYQKRGDIFIETDTARVRLPHKRRYLQYQWCGVREGRAIHPSCISTVTYVYDPANGAGAVLYATPPLYDYAEAAHYSEPNNKLYAALHAGGLNRHYFAQSGALFCATCRPELRIGPMSEEMQEKFAAEPLRQKALELPHVTQRNADDDLHR